MIKAIILDFDGVILESVDIKTQAFRELFSRYTPDVEPIVNYHLQNNGVSRFLKFQHIWENILKRRYDNAIQDKLGKEFSEIVVSQVIDCPFVAGALEFLQQFYRKVPLYVASAVPQEELVTIVDKKGLRRYFTVLYGYPPVTKSQAINDVMEKQAISAEEILYIGDSLEDLKAAKAQGALFIARKNKEDFKGYSPPVLDDLNSIANHLKIILEEDIIAAIEENLRLQKEAGYLKLENLGSEWTRRVFVESKWFIKKDININRKAIRSFRKRQIFVGDLPIGWQSRFNLLNIIDGARRGHVRMLKGFLRTIEEAGFRDLLKKYPCSDLGNPNVFCYRGYRFSLLWIKHIYSLGLFKKYIAGELKDDFVALDLGGGCGMFSGLLKQEFKASHHILVDLPEHLALAHYYLGLEFAQASIATYKDLIKIDLIDKEIIKKYDFILVPPFFYHQIAKDSIDVFTNFMSLQEMSRQYFDFYFKREPFLSAKTFFTINRYQSAPTYDNGLSIKDYPLDGFTKIHFDTCPLFINRYKRALFFLYKDFLYPSQHFEFIGQKRGRNEGV